MEDFVKTNNKQLLLINKNNSSYWYNVFNDEECYEDKNIYKFINSNKWKIISVNTNTCAISSQYSKTFKEQIVILFEINE